MYINDILSSEQSEYVSSLTRKTDNGTDEESGGSSLPLSWGADTVKISAEARAAQQSSSTAEEGEDAESEEDATAAFGSFMSKARGATSSDSSDQLESLKSKLQQLQSKKSQILSNAGLSDDMKEAQAGAIDGQISQIMSEIAQLQAQAAA